MPVQTQSPTLSHLVKGELPDRQSRELVTVLADEDLSLGSVIGKVLFAAPAGEADGDNTGDGALGSIALGQKAKQGTYTIQCITAPSEAAADDAVFAVFSPDGERLADAVQAVAYASPQIAFTIGGADAADSVVGDVYTIAVAPGSGKVAELDPAGLDGRQFAYGFMLDDYGSTVDVPGVAIVKDAEIVASGLVWPDGITTDQKTQALAQLRAAGIMVREEA